MLVMAFHSVWKMVYYVEFKLQKKREKKMERVGYYIYLEDSDFCLVCCIGVSIIPYTCKSRDDTMDFKISKPVLCWDYVL